MERRRQALSEINVTPFVDVMLVLLVIFMATAPLLQQGVDVNLPQATGQALSPAERIVITIKKDGRIFLNRSVVTIDSLKTLLSGRKEKEVFLKADRDVPYGVVVEVMGELKEAGVERLGMVTEPKTRLK
jgi:biopolymer transport protein TolR